MSATTGNFIEGGEFEPDPFTGLAPGQPLTLAEQARREDQRRQRELQETARQNAAIKSRPGGYNETRGRDYQDSLDASNRRVVQDRKDRDRYGDRMKLGFGQALWEDPLTMGILAAPLLTTGAGLAVGGTAGLGFGAGTGSIAAGEAAAPVIVANEAIPGAATAGPGFTQAAADAYNAAHGIGAATTAATTAGTTATAAAPAAKAGFDVGAAFKEVSPILGAVAPFAIDAIKGGNTKEQDALVAKQRQMAKEAEEHRREAQESRMNALGQQLLAMNPSNQMMARMFGPDAAFQPEQMAAMTQNPMPPPAVPPELKALEGKNTKNTPQQDAAFRAYMDKVRQYEEGNRKRSEMMMNGITPPGPGPAPLQPRTPQPARKY